MAGNLRPAALASAIEMNSYTIHSGTGYSNVPATVLFDQGTNSCYESPPQAYYGYPGTTTAALQITFNYDVKGIGAMADHVYPEYGSTLTCKNYSTGATISYIGGSTPGGLQGQQIFGPMPAGRYTFTDPVSRNIHAEWFIEATGPLVSGGTVAYFTTTQLLEIFQRIEYFTVQQVAPNLIVIKHKLTNNYYTIDFYTHTIKINNQVWLNETALKNNSQNIDYGAIELYAQLFFNNKIRLNGINIIEFLITNNFFIKTHFIMTNQQIYNFYNSNLYKINNVNNQIIIANDILSFVKNINPLPQYSYIETLPSCSIYYHKKLLQIIEHYTTYNKGYTRYQLGLNGKWYYYNIITGMGTICTNLDQTNTNLELNQHLPTFSTIVGTGNLLLRIFPQTSDSTITYALDQITVQYEI